MTTRYLRRSAGQTARKKWRLFVRLQQNATANMRKSDRKAVLSTIWDNMWQGKDSTFTYQ